MSSARSNAAARSRRAGGNEPPPPPQQMNGRPGQQSNIRPGQSQMQQPAQQTKMSLSDAIGLITLRLGRIENVVQHLQTDLPPNDFTNQSSDIGENMRVVDDEVFTSIVNRLDQLESGQKQIITKITTQSQLQSQLQSQIQLQTKQVQQTKPTIETVQQSTVISSQTEVKISQLSETIEGLHLEINELKNMLLKLQSFTMETNQKLSDIIFSDNSAQEQEHQNNNLNMSDGMMTNGLQGFLEMLQQSQQSNNMSTFIQQDTSETINISSNDSESKEEIVVEEL